MKIKTEKITIEYEGWTVISPGGYFDGDAITSSFDVSALNIPLVNAKYAHVDSLKNAVANREFAVAHDFADFESAFSYKNAAESHVASSPSGDLTIQVDGLTNTYKAAVEQLSSRIFLAPDSIRLVLRWNFLTGKEVE